MRNYPETEYDRAELADLNAEPWMVELLRQNPSCNAWGPGEDYMTAESHKTHGWRGLMSWDSWSQFSFTIDDLNIVANFHFELHRPSTSCEACGGSGYATAARRVADAFYDFDKTGSRWCGAITLDEAQALVDQGRLQDAPAVLDQAFVDSVNEANRTYDPQHWKLHHDASNRTILVNARCKRLGYDRKCHMCLGKGYVYTAPAAQVQLVLWVLHPRKGASRGAVVGNIQQEDLPGVYAMLRRAAEQNAQRFARIPAST